MHFSLHAFLFIVSSYMISYFVSLFSVSSFIPSSHVFLGLPSGILHTWWNHLNWFSAILLSISSIFSCYLNVLFRILSVLLLLLIFPMNLISTAFILDLCFSVIVKDSLLYIIVGLTIFFTTSVFIFWLAHSFRVQFSIFLNNRSQISILIYYCLSI